jgi:hypothetical protein
MRKKAVIIANNHGLNGITQDISNVQKFLQSLQGGAWNPDEIKVYLNPTKSSLELDIATDRLLNFDYYFLVFTGHGSSNQRETILSINKSEKISENTLKNISKKQINIYDCCRPVNQVVSFGEKSLSMESSYDSIGLSRAQVRAAFESRINQAAEQQVYLYSCKVGECSWDTGDGALYLTNLIKSAKKFSSKDVDRPYKLVIEAHSAASEIVKNQSKDSDYPQNPDYMMLRLLPEQQLVLSINPYNNIF